MVLVEVLKGSSHNPFIFSIPRVPGLVLLNPEPTLLQAQNSKRCLTDPNHHAGSCTSPTIPRTTRLNPETWNPYHYCRPSAPYSRSQKLSTTSAFPCARTPECKPKLPTGGRLLCHHAIRGVRQRNIASIDCSVNERPPKAGKISA